MNKRRFQCNLIAILLICVSGLCLSCGSGSGTAGDSEGNTASITLTAAPTSIPADSGQSLLITATLRDSTGQAVDRGTSLTFETQIGTFPLDLTTYTTSTPTESGVVTVSLMAGAGTTAGGGTVTATSNNVTQAVDIEFTAPIVGSVTVTAGPASIPADGVSTTTITTAVRDGDNEYMPDGTTVNFTTTAGTLSSATAETFNGLATVTLTASMTAQTVTITATVGQESGQTTVDFVTILSFLSLGLSQPTVLSDNSDSTTIRAEVKDAGNAGISGVTVSFSATGGHLSAPLAVTDSEGYAEVTFSSGASDPSNRVVTVRAEVTAFPENLVRYIPVQVTGTVLTLDTDRTGLEVGGGAGDDQATLTITAKDAGNIGIFNAPLLVTASPPNILEFDPEAVYDDTQGAMVTGYTDVMGNLVVTVTGIQADDDPVTVTVEGLGTTATQTYIVGAVGDVFSIIAPTEDPYSASTSEDVSVRVNAPDPIAQVEFATTLGVWDGGTDKVVTVPVVANEAEAELSSSEAGTANILVSDADDPSISASMVVLFSAPSSEAAKISLQASASVVAPSVGGVSNSVTLTATVLNATDQVVGGAPVTFYIVDTTGGGETVSPPIAYTDDFGVAVATFTSGSLGTDAGGVTVVAELVDNPAVSDQVQIIIGGTAGAIVIGQSTQISSTNNNTAYLLPMSVMVSDANGSPVSGAIVTLNLWPTRYRTGCWVEFDDEWGIGACFLTSCEYYPLYSEWYPNEDDFWGVGDDRYRNIILDPGEDVGPAPPGVIAPDGELTPPLSAAGGVPPTVITEENGIASFDLSYLKSSAGFIEIEITASTVVSGTENIGTYVTTLPWAAGEEPNLPHSAYNYYVEIPNRLPTDISLDSTSVNENAGIDTEVGTFSTTDADNPCDTHTYTLVPGVGSNDNALFTIDNADYVLRTAAVFDYETVNTYSIRVQTDDGEGGTYERAFTITINDVNDNPPTDITMDSTTVPESQPIGTVVGTFTTTDVDTVGTHTYSLVAGVGDTNNASFTIVGDELQTAEVFTIPPNIYSIRVETDDGVNAPYQEQFVITVIP